MDPEQTPQSITDFGRYLEEKNLEKAKIAEAIALVRDMNRFLSLGPKSPINFTYDDIQTFAEHLVEIQKNQEANFVYLLYYGYSLNSHVLIEAMMEHLDGGEMIPNFEKQILDRYGPAVRDEIFQGLKLPPMGAHPKKRPEIIKALVGRFIAKYGLEESTRFFKVGLRDKYPDSYIKPREIFQKVQDIDKFLEIKHKTLIDTLAAHLEAGTLFFTQPITQEVLDFVKADQKISAGVRQGDAIIMKKVPYMAHKALQESDPKKYRYHICHNPLIREAFLEEDQPISPIFCNCSGGFLKNFWEAVLGVEVDVEVLDSAMMGGKWCEFAIHLPPEFVSIHTTTLPKL